MSCKDNHSFGTCSPPIPSGLSETYLYRMWEFRMILSRLSYRGFWSHWFQLLSAMEYCLRCLHWSRLSRYLCLWRSCIPEFREGFLSLCIIRCLISVLYLGILLWSWLIAAKCLPGRTWSWKRYQPLTRDWWPQTTLVWWFCLPGYFWFSYHDLTQI